MSALMRGYNSSFLATALFVFLSPVLNGFKISKVEKFGNRPSQKPYFQRGTLTPSRVKIKN
jgi:hypothetical protein